jgi:hypothetical protein
MAKDSLFHYEFQFKNFILLSIFFDECFYFERVIFIYYSNSRIENSLCKLDVLISNSHFFSIYCEGESSLDRMIKKVKVVKICFILSIYLLGIKHDSYSVVGLDDFAVLGATAVAVVSEFPVVHRPPLGTVTKSLFLNFLVLRHSNFYQVTLQYLYFKVVFVTR